MLLITCSMEVKILALCFGKISKTSTLGLGLTTEILISKGNSITFIGSGPFLGGRSLMQSEISIRCLL